MTGDVLCRHAVRPLCKRGFVVRLFLVSEFALGMSVEIGAIAVERKHQQQFGIHARGGNFIRGKAICGVNESLFQLHRTISPQRHF